DAFLFEELCGFHGNREKVRRAQQTDITGGAEPVGLCDISSRRVCVHERLTLFTEPEVEWLSVINGRAEPSPDFPSVARTENRHVGENSQDGNIFAGMMCRAQGCVAKI